MNKMMKAKKKYSFFFFSLTLLIIIHHIKTHKKNLKPSLESID